MYYQTDTFVNQGCVIDVRFNGYYWLKKNISDYISFIYLFIETFPSLLRQFDLNLLISVCT